jgi:ElaB/YqjD/DUF883 family membrane-anchored ribosome-binding protein
MADAHGDNDLRRLEREAEAARARLHDTIAEIKDPRTIENAKLEMKHRAEEMKDQIVGYITGAKDTAIESGRQQGNEFTRKLQRTAIGNPLSVALIGAGIGWHLYKKPPITTALIGAGIWQMVKGWDSTPNDTAFRDPYNRVSPRGYVPGGVAGYGYEDEKNIASVTDRMKAAATNLSYEAQTVVAGAQDALSGAADRVRDAVGMGADTAQGSMARGSLAHAADDMSRLGAGMAERAGAQVQSTSARVQDMAEDATDRMRNMADNATDKMRGVAGAATDTMRDMNDKVRGIASTATETARGMADEAQRRVQPVLDRVTPYVDEHRNQLGMLLVLGGIGALAGGWLRGSETGRRWMNEARDRMDDSWDSVQDGMRSARDAVSPRGDWTSRGAGLENWRDTATSTASSAMSRVSDQADSLRRSAMENAGEWRDRGASTMRSAQELGSEHPLLLSAIGLAIGAVLGGMIRQTSFESETFGEMAQNLRDTAADALQGNMENLTERASNVASAVVGAVTGDTNSDDPAKAAQAQRNRVNA